MDFTITVQGAKEGANRLHKLATQMDSVTLKRAANELEVIGVWLEGQVKRQTPVYTGALRASIFSELRTSGQSLQELVSSPMIHAAPIEFGRTPGKKAPPVDALRSWARRVLGDERAAYPVARAIGKKGFSSLQHGSKQQMFQDAFDQNVNKILQMLKNIGIHVGDDLLKHI